VGEVARNDHGPEVEKQRDSGDSGELIQQHRQTEQGTSEGIFTAEDITKTCEPAVRGATAEHEDVVEK
jgi:hypothetical protein